ncbi:hypothetical protein [Segatella copri]|uniref:GLUG domain-containing protein n=1 Tax=Segatella copri TaxID=165179 RepID=A0AA92TR75_9BACT|nr:hypothetical protein [Segatella copri]RGU95405.1 hypothetical protein DWW35_10015 [Segatella copri]
MGGAWAQTQPSKGDGKVGNPYIITKAEELEWFRDQVNSGQYSICAKIADNVEVIDMSSVCHAADKSQNLEEKSWVPIGNRNIIKYRGTFDGNGKTITNLYINASQLKVGLFGYTYKGTIKNLTFEYANVTNTKDYTGILVGDIENSNLQNIKISNTCQIKGGKYTGGIAGELDGNAYNCVNYATVQGIKYVGGFFGWYSRKGNSITACANYGNVTASSEMAGGLVGYFSGGTIQDCANYGDVKGTNRVAGMAGFVSDGKVQNVFSYGNISVTNKIQNVGMVFGFSSYGATEGMVAYYSGAKLIVNGKEKEVKAFGNGTPSEDNATGFTKDQLKSGVVAYQLQQNASSEAKWGQNLANGGDIYPVIASEHKVYANNLTLNCKTNEVVTGSFTNNPTSSAINYQHGQTINHHVATNATCTEAATKEYWQCQDCQRTYSDSQLTVELTDVTNTDQPALGHHSNEDGYCDRCLHYVAVKPSEENGVYLIAKPCHLAWFRDYVNGTIVNDGEAAGTAHSSASAKLTADIDLKNYCHAAEDGKELLSWIPIGNYNNRWKGNIDGQAHTISNLYIKTAQNYVGLFGFTEGATIQDLIFDYAKVDNVNTTGTNTMYTGILAGYAYASTNSPAHIKGIKTTNNCTVIGQEDTGGIVGSAKINLENCENRSSVKGTRLVGGIAGSCTERNIRRCTNYGTVENDGSYIGGIIGYAYGTSIEDCANYGKITSTGWHAGGIAGKTLENSSIQNVFSYGDVTNTNEVLGIIIGYVEGTLTAKGIVTYNKEALLNNSSENIKIVGTGSLAFEDGKVEADVVKAFTKQQIKSGEVAYLLNGSTSGGELAWYQKLGTDAYPVLTATKGNTVYNGSFRYCDNTTSSYSNSSSDSELIHVASATLASPEHDADKHIYHMGCRNEGCTLHKYVADMAGNIEVTKDANNKFVATEDLTLADGEDFKDYEPFISKTISYSRNIPEGSTWGTLCLPFAIDQSKETGCKFYRLTGIDKDCITLESYEDGAEIPAGTPVLFKMNEGVKKLEISAQDADLVKEPVAGTNTDVNLVGSFTKIGGNGNQGLAENDYIIGKDKFWRVSDLDGGNRVGIKPMRAYIHPANEYLARAAMLSIGKGDGTTAIDNLNAISNDANAEYYDANGRRTNGLQKGLNIVKRGSKTYKIMVK